MNLGLIDIFAQKDIKAFHTIKVGNRGVSDDFQLEYAAKNNYVVLTHNRWDFRKLHEAWEAEGKAHGGILTIGCGDPEKIADRVERFVKEVYATLPPSFCAAPPA